MGKYAPHIHIPYMHIVYPLGSGDVLALIDTSLGLLGKQAGPRVGWQPDTQTNDEGGSVALGLVDGVGPMREL